MHESAAPHDVAVIGGGPAGASVATRLAQRGWRVLLLEREQFPRFHIGESLLPCSMPLLAELGVKPAVDAAEFVIKHGAEFVSADGELRRRYPFAEGVVPGPGSALEVERADFDQLLLEHAALSGVDVRQGFTVTEFDVGEDPARAAPEHGVSLRATDSAGSTHDFSARLLVDASGQRSLVAQKLGLRQMDPELRNFAVFSHYTGAARNPGAEAGDISIVLAPEGWWWVIPLRHDRTSLGFVARSSALRGQKPNQAYLDAQLASSAYLAQRFARAERVAPVRAVSDYSYVSRQLVGDRWLLVGDAAAFIDPVFSTGIHLGLLSAFRAADSMHAALSRGKLGRSRFRQYERWFARVVRDYRGFVSGFYTPEFAEIMMAPTDRFQLRQAVTSLLAGHGLSPFAIRWRIAVFRAVTRLNRDLRLAPRLAGRREAALALSAPAQLPPAG